MSLKFPGSSGVYFIKDTNLYDEHQVSEPDASGEWWAMLRPSPDAEFGPLPIWRPYMTCDGEPPQGKYIFVNGRLFVATTTALWEYSKKDTGPSWLGDCEWLEHSLGDFSVALNPMNGAPFVFEIGEFIVFIGEPTAGPNEYEVTIPFYTIDATEGIKEYPEQNEIVPAVEFYVNSCVTNVDARQPESEIIDVSIIDEDFYILLDDVTSRFVGRIEVIYRPTPGGWSTGLIWVGHWRKMRGIVVCSPDGVSSLEWSPQSDYAGGLNSLEYEHAVAIWTDGTNLFWFVRKVVVKGDESAEMISEGNGQWEEHWIWKNGARLTELDLYEDSLRINDPESEFLVAKPDVPNMQVVSSSENILAFKSAPAADASALIGRWGDTSLNIIYTAAWSDQIRLCNFYDRENYPDNIIYCDPSGLYINGELRSNIDGLLDNPISYFEYRLFLGNGVYKNMEYEANPEPQDIKGVSWFKPVFEDDVQPSYSEVDGLTVNIREKAYNLVKPFQVRTLVDMTQKAEISRAVLGIDYPNLEVTAQGHMLEHLVWDSPWWISIREKEEDPHFCNKSYWLNVNGGTLWLRIGPILSWQIGVGSVEVQRRIAV